MPLVMEHFLNTWHDFFLGYLLTSVAAAAVFVCWIILVMATLRVNTCKGGSTKMKTNILDQNGNFSKGNVGCIIVMGEVSTLI